MKKINLLILVRRFSDTYPKHQHLFDSIMALETFANIRYWWDDGDIHKILATIDFIPDFIYYYDITWGYSLAPKITGLGSINIPKACHIFDCHYAIRRKEYIESNKIDLIFSPSKDAFLKTHPEYKDKLRWLPFSINPSIVNDWKLEKSVDFLLMGQFYQEGTQNHSKKMPPKGKYVFREAVYSRMKAVKGFQYIPHPGHTAQDSEGLMINNNYTEALNRAKIFFTCGSQLEYPVAKFFEALGSNTLLLAKPNKDILELGFQDGIHFVACHEENFYEKAFYYLKNDAKRREISNNGYEFIHNYHTNDIRALQMMRYIQLFLKNPNKYK